MIKTNDVNNKISNFENALFNWITKIWKEREEKQDRQVWKAFASFPKVTD